MKRLLAIACLLSVYTTNAQQVPQFSQYLRNQYLVNPAAAGVYDFVDLTIGGRLQWLGFDDAPKTSYLSVSSPLKKTSRARYNPGIRISSGPVRNPEIKTGNLKHALGGQLIADQYGAFRQLRASVTYALHLPLSRSYNLSFGANVGVSNRSFLADRAQTLNMMTGAAYVDNTYDNFVASTGAQNTLDVGAGFYLYSDKMFFGVSADQLTKDFVKFGNVETTFDPNMHFQGTAGVKIPISRDVTLMPSVLAKYTQAAPLSIEGSLQFEYKEWLWIGASYRNQDAIVAMAGLNISERFKFGYSYDFNVSRMQNYSAGGHELVLGLMLGR